MRCETTFLLPSSVYIHVPSLDVISPSLANNPNGKVEGHGCSRLVSFFLFFFFKLFRIGYVAEDTNPYEASVSSAIGSRLGS